MNTHSFRRTPLATGIAIALGASTIVPVQAQEQVIEEITVTGIRSSLISSMNTKRSSNGVVDAITAEDIGKFPDTNLAESGIPMSSAVIASTTPLELRLVFMKMLRATAMPVTVISSITCSCACTGTIVDAPKAMAIPVANGARNECVHEQAP